MYVNDQTNVVTESTFFSVYIQITSYVFQMPFTIINYNYKRYYILMPLNIYIYIYIYIYTWLK